MKRNITNSIFTLLLLFSVSTLLVSCGDDDGDEPTVDLSFPGTYAITGATTVTSSTNILTELAGLLLADSPCDSTDASDQALIQLSAATGDNNSGSISIVCSVSGNNAAAGTWSFTQPQGPFSMNLNATVAGMPVTVPLTLNSFNAQVDANGVVQQIVGNVNLIAFSAVLPALAEEIQLTIDRVN